MGKKDGVMVRVVANAEKVSDVVVQAAHVLLPATGAFERLTRVRREYLNRALDCGSAYATLSEKCTKSLLLGLHKMKSFRFFLLLIVFNLSFSVNSYSEKLSSFVSERCSIVSSDSYLKIYFEMNSCADIVSLARGSDGQKSFIGIAISQSEYEVVKAILELGARDTANIKELVLSLFDRSATEIEKSIAILNGSDRYLNKYNFEFIELVIDIIKNSDDKHIIISNLRDGEFFDFSLLNTYCDQINIDRFNSDQVIDRFLSEIDNELRQNLPPVLDLHHYRALTRVGLLNEDCVEKYVEGVSQS